LRPVVRVILPHFPLTPLVRFAISLIPPTLFSAHLPLSPGHVDRSFPPSPLLRTTHCFPLPTSHFAPAYSKSAPTSNDYTPRSLGQYSSSEAPPLVAPHQPRRSWEFTPRPAFARPSHPPHHPSLLWPSLRLVLYLTFSRYSHLDLVRALVNQRARSPFAPTHRSTDAST